MQAAKRLDQTIKNDVESHLKEFSTRFITIFLD